MSGREAVDAAIGGLPADLRAEWDAHWFDPTFFARPSDWTSVCERCWCIVATGCTEEHVTWHKTTAFAVWAAFRAIKDLGRRSERQRKRIRRLADGQ